MSMFQNRLAKNTRHLRKWAQRQGLTAYRLYDRDIPELPYAVDWYDGRVHIAEYPRRAARKAGGEEAARGEVLQAVERELQVPPEHIYLKTHAPMPWRQAQYGRAGEGHAIVTVRENGLAFEVNLSDYLDTGLFMDHRDTRARVRSEAKGKRMLNLFAYTGSFSVYAASGGATTTTVDLSNTYCDWAERNFALNGLKPGRVVRADVLEWIERCTEQFELVVLDPPSFSTSKKMSRSFEVQRDHRRLIEKVLGLLAPEGQLYFSTNFLRFELDERLTPAEELTPRSIPQDFRPGIHRCWRFVA